MTSAASVDGTETVPIIQSAANKRTLLSTVKTWLESYFVSGPASATGNAVARYDATTGKLIKDSYLIVDDDGRTYIENNTPVTGNARGAGAIDLQCSRSSATQVVSGANSFAAGINNTVTGSQSAAFGRDCTLSASRAIAVGVFASNAIMGSDAVGGGVSAGIQQMGRIPLGASTTDATPTVLNIFATASNRPTVPAKAAWMFKVHLIAHTSTGTYRVAAWDITGVIARDGSNNTLIVGTPTVTQTVNESTWITTDPTVTADDTNESLAITVTGLAATTIRWTAGVYYTQALAS